MRSWLLVSADDEGQLAHIAGLACDAIVLDLASAQPNNRSAAQQRARDWLEAHRNQVIAQQQQHSRWVKISPFGSPHWRDDLRAVLHSAPDGIVLPRCTAPDQLQALTAELYENEEREGLRHNAVKIVPLLGATAASALTIAEFGIGTNPRLAGFGWDMAELARSLGAANAFDPDGHLTGPFQQVRSQTLMAARARGVMPIDSEMADFSFENSQKAGAADTALLAHAKKAKSAGFEGMFTSDPNHVPLLNEHFAQSEADFRQAEAIVAAFANSGGADTAIVDGRIVDRSDLARAERAAKKSRPNTPRSGGDVALI